MAGYLRFSIVMGRTLVVLALSVVALAAAAPALAQDKTLSEDFPLVHLGDAFPIAQGQGAVLAGTGVTLLRRGPDEGFFPVQVLYGILPRTQLQLSTTLSSHPHTVDEPHAGDLTTSVRVNFGRETRILPSFALLGAITAPTGVDSRAFGFELKGYATKSVTRSLFLHLNAAEDFADRLARGERQGRYHLALGPSFTIPEHATMMLAADVFADQGRNVHEPTTVGVEAGVRQRLTANVYFTAGAGTEFAGSGNRAAFFFVMGVSVGFGPFGGAQR